MKSADSKRLVIDASIARAAGRTDHPISKACRIFLEGVLNICHHVVLTEEIREEWSRHQSNFTLVWRSSMVARKKVAWHKIAQNDVFRTEIQNLDFSEKECAAVLKDAHLVEAALKTDLTVVSLDETARGLLRKAAQNVKPLKQVLWVNPTKDEEHTMEWLEGGAKGEEARQLGFDDSVK
jgi:predicted nucleic acid-binding protein